MPNAMILRNVFRGGELQLQAGRVVELDKEDFARHERRGNARAATADELKAAAPAPAPTEAEEKSGTKRKKGE